jgi:hypothetical protein
MLTHHSSYCAAVCDNCAFETAPLQTWKEASDLAQAHADMTAHITWVLQTTAAMFYPDHGA